MVSVLSSSIVVASVAGICFYFGVVASQRYKRRNYVASLPPPTDTNLAELHHFIVQILTDFPFLYRTALEFAFFKTYGIPSISKLLVATGEITNACPRRIADTDLLIREFCEHPLDNERSILAMRRMNHFHSKYHISNGDYLYVLCVFIIEPIRWINQFGFRKLTTNEIEALCIHWRCVGIYMGITDIPGSYPEVVAYIEEYEKANFCYTDQNRQVANATIEVFLAPFPKCMHSFGHKAAHALCPPNLCEAMGFEKSSKLLKSTLEGALSLMGLVTRLFCFPRSQPKHRTGEFPNPNGSYCPRFAMYDKQLYKEGYFIGKLGPQKFENDGMLGELHTPKSNSVRCPELKKPKPI
ncbi:hypothetical protein QVD99_002653 [Batrachochytrium dendrobatidis]|uniref:ER-bound oxygenase mpaB/mpaB'/Rubber oxygenase catalytic domain-containing protein n=1 Tax=Batrachochytrium dendrobatidis (strain JEL423) TaxID=403673 RepID=A0A177WK38_BATDL|nr:hypothetical protein O5D80_006877 [Batrachochytrium dendrobatidis]KAK5670883.1 hypothetical protein QVD99_002653 [Batrachochytrium dendrobatidis]OAJ40443.1 hypothetical protein BDEG_24178 [Batrachochytrium dendrobatidis JEL423]